MEHPFQRSWLHIRLRPELSQGKHQEPEDDHNLARLHRGDSGLWLVNELGMEEYLCGVVPGEMPSSFAPEALKAQAVCARTYAAIQALGTTYETYHADVDKQRRKKWERKEKLY